MSDPVIIIVVLVGVALVTVLYAWAMWRSRHSARYILRAIGIIAFLAGLYVTGVAQLLLDGVRTLVEWAQEQTLDNLMWTGIALGGLGVLLFAIGGFITPPTRAEARQRRAERRAEARRHSDAATPPPLPARPRPTSGEPEPTLVIPTSAATTAKNPDDEVTSILKKHGIQ